MVGNMGSCDPFLAAGDEMVVCVWFPGDFPYQPRLILIGHFAFPFSLGAGGRFSKAAYPAPLRS
jgi:hypothetical protein